ncbi:MAG: hypothetical protein AAF899_08935 [Pseudomonadota bacterium]
MAQDTPSRSPASAPRHTRRRPHRIPSRTARAALLAAAVAFGSADHAHAQFDATSGLVDLQAVDWSTVINDVPDYPGVPLYQMPRFVRERAVIAGRAAEGDDRTALRLTDRMARRYPLVAELHATRALLLSRLGRIEEALTAVDVALDLGYKNLSQIRRAPAYANLTDHRRFRRIAGKTREPLPLSPVPRRAASIDGQTALVSALNTRWDVQRQLLSASFILPDDLDTRPTLWDLDGDGVAEARGGLVPTGALARLPDRIRSGEAAGLGGVFYDNRDRDHASLDRADFPRLTFIEYGEAAREAGVDYGPNRSMHFDAIVIGNSSTALTGGPFSRSQARSLITGPGDVEQQTRQFVRNQLYVFPSAGDYGPNLPVPQTTERGVGMGDKFPALVPFFVVSQGWSHSDYPFLDALATILSALNPELRAELQRRRLIAPTLQMILRRGMRGVDDDLAHFMAGPAHRPVMDGDDIDLERMVAIAERLTPATTPPMPILVVDQDLDAQDGVEVFGDGLSEVLFDAPFAVGRIWRSTRHTRRMVLRAGVAERRAGQEVALEWRVLQGLQDKVRITPLGPEGDRVAVEIDWHGRYPVPGRDDMTTDRVDVGVFARVGDEASIPATLSIVFPPRQRREYEAAPDGGMRLAAVDYAADLPGTVDADPLLFPERRWTDLLRWNADGSLDGWRRRHHDSRAEEYSANGLLIRQRDDRGRPALLEAMDYPTEREPNGTLLVEALPTGERFEVIYPSDDARSGALVPADRQGLPDDPDAEAGSGGPAPD